MKGLSRSERAVLVPLWLALAFIVLLSSAASVSVPANSSLGVSGSDSTDVDLTLATDVHNITATNLTATTLFHFTAPDFRFVGTIDNNRQFPQRAAFATIVAGLQQFLARLVIFYEAPDNTVIPPGTEASFYFNNYKVHALWSPRGSQGNAWTRSILRQAAIDLMTYFQNGEGKDKNRHPVRSTGRYMNQQSTWLFETVEVATSPLRIASLAYVLQGTRYDRDSLPSADANAVVLEAIAWARSRRGTDRVPDGTWRVFDSNGVSIRILVDRSITERPAFIKWRDLATMLEGFRGKMTGSGERGWCGAWVSFGPPQRKAGFWELALGDFPSLSNGVSSSLSVANVTSRGTTNLASSLGASYLDQDEVLIS